jgi:predicted nucleotidyltransferase
LVAAAFGVEPMLETVDEIAVCREFKARLAEAVPLITLELFGSRARGDGESDSDFDFLVEVETNNPAVRRQVRLLAWEIAFKYNTVFHTVIMSREQLTSRPERVSLLVQAVRREGIVI